MPFEAGQWGKDSLRETGRECVQAVSSRKLIVPEVVGFLVVKEWQGIQGSWSGENKGECVEDKI